MTASIRQILRDWLRYVPALNRVRCWTRDRLSDAMAAFLRRTTAAKSRWGPPKGFYSEHELLQKHQVSGKVLLEAQERPVLAPDSLRKLCGLKQDAHQPWPVLWTYHPQTRLIGKSLVRLDSHKHLSMEGAFGPGAHKSDPAWKNLSLPNPIHLQGNWTSVLGQWSEGYYHWTLDAVPRLAMLPELPADTNILVPAKLASYQLDMLRWLGLENRFRSTAEKHLTIENYYFCSATSMTGCYNPFGVQFLRRSFLAHADSNYESPRRFYLRRVGKFRPITNERELLEYFEKRGWAIVDTEQLSLARQIQLFARAEMICAPHGAGLTNLLWCQPGCKVLELCTSNFLNGVFEGIAQCVGATHRYLVFKGDAGYRSAVDPKAIDKALEF